jgi:hypothetical protein
LHSTVGIGLSGVKGRASKILERHVAQQRRHQVISLLPPKRALISEPVTARDVVSPASPISTPDPLHD